MGRASRWLRRLLGGGKKPPPNPCASPARPTPSKVKNRWGFLNSFRDKEPHRGQLPARCRTTPGSMEDKSKRAPAATGGGGALAMDEDEQSKRAIAVAAATAAVAEAAVAAAQAAAAMVRLTGGGRSATGFAGASAFFWAAVKIQAAFRGYLARRALKALRGLVKLQALVRGNIVRKQAAETMRCMQALVRVQARARACRVLHSERSSSEKGHRPQADPLTPEKHGEEEDQIIISKTERSSSSKRNSKKGVLYTADHARADSAGWNWWDRWMEEPYRDSRDAARKVGTSASIDDEKSANILQIDPGKQQQLNHRRRSNHYHSSCSTVTSDQNSRSFLTVPSSSSVDMQQSPTSLTGPRETEEYGESPQLYSAASRQGSSRKEGPYTPSKSEYSFSIFSGCLDSPNYMGNTESFRAKVRSQSAPKRRPEFEKSKKALAHGYRQQQSDAQRSNFLHTKAYPGSGRLDRLGMPITS